MKLIEEYAIAREVYQTIKIVPKGHCISRGEINSRLRASSDQRRTEIISKAIRHMLHLGQIRKRMDHAACTVFFWTPDNMNLKGESTKWDPNEEVIDYLSPIPKEASPDTATNTVTDFTGSSKIEEEQEQSQKQEPHVLKEDPVEADVDSEDDTEFYMMKDTKKRGHRLLLRPDGSTLSISIDEIVFIQSLKPPYVTL